MGLLGVILKFNPPQKVYVFEISNLNSFIPFSHSLLSVTEAPEDNLILVDGLLFLPLAIVQDFPTLISLVKNLIWFSLFPSMVQDSDLFVPLVQSHLTSQDFYDPDLQTLLTSSMSPSIKLLPISPLLLLLPQIPLKIYWAGCKEIFSFDSKDEIVHSTVRIWDKWSLKA